MLSADDSGALRDSIIGVTLALADATLASSGCKVVKNVVGYDLPKLATGALGTLGVITRAVFRFLSFAKIMIWREFHNFRTRTKRLLWCKFRLCSVCCGSCSGCFSATSAFDVISC